MPDRMILVVPAVLSLIGVVLMGIAVWVVVTGWRTYARGRNPRSHSRPQPVSQAALVTAWSAIVGIVGLMLSGAGLLLALRIIGWEAG